MDIPESFIYRLLHGTLNDLGLQNVADKLVEEINDKGLFIDKSNEKLIASSKKVKLLEWFNGQIIKGDYDAVLQYLENIIHSISINGTFNDEINKFPNVVEVLNLTDADKSSINHQQLISVIFVMIYLIKRIIFLEKLIIFLLNNKKHETNNNLIQYLSDELIPILDSITLNQIIKNLFDEEIVNHLTRELESSKLLSLIMELLLNDFQIENLIFNKKVLFYSINLQNNNINYLLNKLRQLAVQKYFKKLFSNDFYEGSLPYLNYKLPSNFLYKIIQNSIEYNRFKSSYYLPSRIIEDKDDEGNDQHHQPEEEFVPPIESSINNYYKPRFPNKLLHTLSNHNGQVWFTKFSPLGKYLITGAADGKLIIHDVLDNFKVLATLISDDVTDKNVFINSNYKQLSGSKAVIYCCWDPNEEFLVSGSLDTRVRIWDIRNLKNKSKKINKRITRSSIDDLHDEFKLTACFVLGEKIRTWSCEFLPKVYNNGIPQFIIGSPDKVLKAYDVFGTELFDFYGNTHENSKNNQSNDVRMKLEDDDEDVDIDIGHNNPNTTSNSEALVDNDDEDDDDSEAIDYEDNEHDVDRNYPSSNIRSRTNISLHTVSTSSTNLRESNGNASKQESFNRINDLSITPDGKILITANNNKQVDFYTIPNLTNIESITKKIASINLHGRLTSCSVSKNGKYLLLSLGPDELQIWNIENLIELGKPILFKKLIGHSQSTFIIRSCFGYVDLKNNQEELVLSGSDEGDIYIWNLFTGQLISRVKGHEGACNSVDWNTSFVPNDETKDYGKIWCSVGDDKLVKIWGPRNL